MCKFNRKDSDLPRLLRDTQVTSIWEVNTALYYLIAQGTTNVLSLDVWRPIRANNALDVFSSAVEKKLATISLPT